MAHKVNLLECIENCLACYRSCYETAVHCLEAGGRYAELSNLRILDECARICRVTAESMMSHSEYETAFSQICAELCERCAYECECFEGDAIMNRCAAVCRRCETTCREMSMPSSRKPAKRAKPSASHPPLM